LICLAIGEQQPAHSADIAVKADGDRASSLRERVLKAVGDELVDQKAERYGDIGAYHQLIEPKIEMNVAGMGCQESKQGNRSPPLRYLHLIVIKR
jgi:hypothetical protein